jgi:phosphatidylglycerol:prolipoprotein diacylglycerol transferase
MLTYPNVDPVIISIGPLQVRWYGLMYIISFLCALFIAKRYLREIGLSEKIPFLENLLFYSFLGLIIGARVGFCFFYYPDYFLAHPLEIVKVWKGGMSFHGGLIGALMSLMERSLGNLLTSLGGWSFQKGVLSPDILSSFTSALLPDFFCF